jgi:integrase
MPVPLHPAVVQELIEWRKESPYSGDGDFLFPSVQLNGRQPLQPDMILKRHLRPASESLRIKKQIGWHSFRHGLATMLRQQGVDLKLAQAMLKHANSRIPWRYQQVVGTEKRDAQQRVMDVLLVPKLKGDELQHPSAPSIANLLSESCP